MNVGASVGVLASELVDESARVAVYPAHRHAVAEVDDVGVFSRLFDCQRESAIDVAPAERRAPVEKLGCLRSRYFFCRSRLLPELGCLVVEGDDVKTISGAECAYEGVDEGLLVGACVRSDGCGGIDEENNLERIAIAHQIALPATVGRRVDQGEKVAVVAALVRDEGEWLLARVEADLDTEVV